MPDQPKPQPKPAEPPKSLPLGSPQKIEKGVKP